MMQEEYPDGWKPEDVEAPGKKFRIRYIGYEPPGGLLSKPLAEAIDELPNKWTSVACSYDVVPRLSIQALQLLREEVLDELYKCHRSKLRLAFLCLAGAVRHFRPLCCLRRPCFCFFEWLGGGPLPPDDLKRQVSQPFWADASRPCRIKSTDWFSKLYLPGRVAYMRPTAMKMLAAGMYEKDTDWVAEWVHREDLASEHNGNLLRVILTYRSLELHFPAILHHAYTHAAQNIGVESGFYDPPRVESVSQPLPPPSRLPA